LKRYGRWISSESRLAPVVCLLSHTTLAPEEFLNSRDASGGATPHVIKWSSVGAYCRELIRNDFDTPPEIKMLANEMQLFLKEKNMSNEFAGRDDFAAALVYLRAGEKMAHTYKSIYLHLTQMKGQFTSDQGKHDESLQYATTDRLIWGFKNLKHPDPTMYGLFFAYGIAFDPSSTFRETLPIRNDSAFILVGAEHKSSIKSMRAARSEPKSPWKFVEFNHYAAMASFRPLEELMTEPESFAARMIEWIDVEAAEINRLVLALK
jgi:hypothetical protein